MIYEDLCSGDDAVFAYVLNWSAWKLQNPGLLPQVAIAFLGPKGAGKTTYGKRWHRYSAVTAWLPRTSIKLRGASTATLNPNALSMRTKRFGRRQAQRVRA